MALSPIALFTYNRPDHTRKTVEALQLNALSPLSDLYIFSDGPKDDVSANGVQEVRNYLKSIKGFKSVSIIEKATNVGLAANIMDGVQQISSRFGKVIVLEDDLPTSPFFLDFMNDGLRLYESDERVISVHGYMLPLKEQLPETFFLRGADCWGWATWKRGWDLFEPNGILLRDRLRASGQTKQFEFDGSFPYMQMLEDQISGERDSWAIRWYASAFLENKYTLYPGKSLVTNIGGDGSGTNHGVEHRSPDPFHRDRIKLYPVEVCQNELAYRAFSAYFRKNVHPNLWNKIKRRLKIMLR